MIDTLTEAYKKKNRKMISKIYQGLQRRTGILCGVHSFHLQVQRSGEYSAGKI